MHCFSGVQSQLLSPPEQKLELSSQVEEVLASNCLPVFGELSGTETAVLVEAARFASFLSGLKGGGEGQPFQKAAVFSFLRMYCIFYLAMERNKARRKGKREGRLARMKRT